MVGVPPGLLRIAPTAVMLRKPLSLSARRYLHAYNLPPSHRSIKVISIILQVIYLSLVSPHSLLYSISSRSILRLP